MSDDESTLVSHLEDLRRALLSCLVAVALLLPVGFVVSPYVIDALLWWCFPAGMTRLHYFAPLEVFWVQLRLALILALAMAYPWCAWRLWRFLLPALYEGERRALKWWVTISTALFALGAAFCVGLILPLLMSFSGGFATPELQPVLGLANFLHLAGWLMFAFGVMFQAPVLVLIAVRFGLVSASSLAKKRPYILTGILILAAILTPPDVVSQIMLAVPTWLLFELGLHGARRMEMKNDREGEQI